MVHVQCIYHTPLFSITSSNAPIHVIIVHIMKENLGQEWRNMNGTMSQGKGNGKDSKQKDITVSPDSIRDFPDHAPFREKSVNLTC